MAIAEIRITGLGGQGVILSGYIIGKAASLFNQQHATLTQSFGPEARGSACSAQVVVSDDRVLYPYVTRPNFMIALSNDGYNTYRGTIADDCTILYEKELVKIHDHGPRVKSFGIPAIRIAEDLGRVIVLNIVMLGFFCAMTGLLPKEALRKAVETSVPKGTEELNLKAFEQGYEYGVNLKKQVEVKA
jgi:2-oxoglutarate ferredoxin oxidoreductase subunit gamma